MVSKEELSDFLEGYSIEPSPKLEEIALRANKEGAISKDELTLLTYMLPFRAFAHKVLSQTDIARESRISKGWVKSKYNTLLDVLAQYLWNEVSQEDRPDIDVRFLPWYKHSPQTRGIGICNRLITPIRNVESLPKESVTVRAVIGYFNGLRDNPKPFLHSPNFKDKSYETVRCVFQEIGYPLPYLKK